MWTLLLHFPVNQCIRPCALWGTVALPSELKYFSMLRIEYKPSPVRELGLLWSTKKRIVWSIFGARMTGSSYSVRVCNMIFLFDHFVVTEFLKFARHWPHTIRCRVGWLFVVVEELDEVFCNAYRTETFCLTLSSIWVACLLNFHGTVSTCRRNWIFHIGFEILREDFSESSGTCNLAS